MKTSLINKKVVDYLQSIADEDTFHMRKNTGHPVCGASYGGQQRSFSLCSSPSTNYPKWMTSKVKRFIRTLPIETNTFNLY